jgi:hypothetical protein
MRRICIIFSVFLILLVHMNPYAFPVVKSATQPVHVHSFPFLEFNSIQLIVSCPSSSQALHCLPATEASTRGGGCMRTQRARRRAINAIIVYWWRQSKRPCGGCLPPLSTTACRWVVDWTVDRALGWVRRRPDLRATYRAPAIHFVLCRPEPPKKIILILLVFYKLFLVIMILLVNGYLLRKSNKN